ncbi:aspartate/glutamate racemase family protein [Alkalibacillus aidingensis]|uniref:aspartate/glutamate racemase family protein n=1 Tax=Alkalibacillus aidingensis TaxID=2747607 RepID=UPI0016608E39|nr:aspartate/glutamate racemase family protein [Alkalibacillus aidingensis]
MKTIGIIGGMSWESTTTYYKLINQEVNQQLGGLHSARCIIYSVDFDEIEKYQSSGDWEKAGAILSDAAQSLERAGASFLVMATNTMHKVIETMEKAVSIPILHIADATAKEIRKVGINHVALLGTKYTMEQDFYKGRLFDQGLQVTVPNLDERNRINDIIFKELVQGEIKESSKAFYLKVINHLRSEGVGAVILGCTEIGLLISQQDLEIPVFDTTDIHAKAAVNEALMSS